MVGVAVPPIVHSISPPAPRYAFLILSLFFDNFIYSLLVYEALKLLLLVIELLIYRVGYRMLMT